MDFLNYARTSSQWRHPCQRPPCCTTLLLRVEKPSQVIKYSGSSKWWRGALHKNVFHHCSHHSKHLSHQRHKHQQVFHVMLYQPAPPLKLLRHNRSCNRIPPLQQPFPYLRSLQFVQVKHLDNTKQMLSANLFLEFPTFIHTEAHSHWYKVQWISCMGPLTILVLLKFGKKQTSIAGNWWMGQHVRRCTESGVSANSTGLSTSIAYFFKVTHCFSQILTQL